MSISMHFSSPVKNCATGGTPGPPGDPDGSKPAPLQSKFGGKFGPPLVHTGSKGSLRRPCETTQWVGCCLVSQMSKSTSAHTGGLVGPGGNSGKVRAPFT